MLCFKIKIFYFRIVKKLIINIYCNVVYEKKNNFKNFKIFIILNL